MASVLLLGTVLLSGCSLAVTPPESGLDKEQRDALVAQSIEYAWQAADLPTLDQPQPGRVVLVGRATWADLVAACMADAGFGTYSGGTGGYTRTTQDAPGDDERLALYECTATIQLDPNDFAFLNSAQLDYLYDYYRESLIPCLELNGVHIGTVQTRKQFQNGAGGWNPYVSSGGALLGGALPHRGLAAKCPAYPTGYGAGYAAR